MTLLPTLILVVLWANHSFAETTQVRTAAVVERGIYSVDAGPPNPVTGVRRVRSARLLQATTDIPAQVGVIFGLRYTLRGTPISAPASVEIVTRYPAPGIARANQIVKTEHRHTVNTVIGVRQYRDFHFAEPEELLPGVWTFEIWHGGRKIGEQRFCVFESGPSGGIPACDKPVS